MGNLPKIKSIILNVTHCCNLKCRYCFENLQPETMTFQVAKDAVDFIVMNAKEENKDNIHITFFGGEPMLAFDSIIKPIVEYVKTLDIKCSYNMTTNGTLLNLERLQYLKQNHINFLLSLDGSKITQDINRPCKDGSSSFDKIPLSDIIKNSYGQLVRLTLTPLTIANFYEDILFLEEQHINKFYALPNLFESWSENDFQIFCTQYQKYKEYFINQFNNKKLVIQDKLMEDNFKNIVRINACISNPNFTIEHRAKSHCGIGSGSAAIVIPNGDLYTCCEFEGQPSHDSIFYIGDIYHGTIDSKREFLSSILDNNKIQSENYDCKNCRKEKICNGGCAMSNFKLTGQFYIESKLACQWDRFLLEESIQIAQQLGNNELFIQYWKEVTKSWKRL